MNGRVTVSLPAELVAEARRAVEIDAAKAQRERALADLERVFGGPPRPQRARPAVRWTHRSVTLPAQAD